MQYSFNCLTDSEITESRRINGSNELSPPLVEGFWQKLTDNFKDPLIIILCIALVIVLLLSIFHYAEWYESIGIALAVILSTFVSTWSEYKNESSFRNLQEEASRIRNNVFRNGKISQVYISEIVAGDYVLLQSGDKVPADGLIAAGEVKIDQSSLTGEAEPVRKTKPPEDYSCPNGDFADRHKVFRGSVVDEGEAVILVKDVGKRSIYGKLAEELSLNDDRQSPLQVKLTKLAKGISKFGYTAAIFIAASFMFKKIVINNHFALTEIIKYLGEWQAFIHDILNALILSIIIIVAAVPEGLPMMIAIVLSLNMRKLLNEKVLVRKLLGIETAGSLNILFSDKTGTITKGKLKVINFLTGDLKIFNTYPSVPDKLRNILSFSIKENTSSVIESTGDVLGGNISERALLQFLDKKSLLEKSEVKIEKRVLFNSARKFSATQVKGKIFENNDSEITMIKGTPELILQDCRYYYDESGNKEPITNLSGLNDKINSISNSGTRLIALATSDKPLNENELPEERTLIGIIGIRDEIRPESQNSIKEALEAGIQVVMITGDKKETAVAIARETGLLNIPDSLVLTSDELNAHSDDELKKILPMLRVVARALPTDKSRLVRIAAGIGKVAAMTGDGVNDSAALKISDVGFAMGSGSEVSKEAGDIVILDDNFKSITRAVLYGRTIFKSIRKFIVFQLTVNVAAVSITFLGPFLGFDFPLTIIQIL
jgi:Ca2+-transporting ATPase